MWIPPEQNLGLIWTKKTCGCFDVSFSLAWFIGNGKNAGWIWRMNSSEVSDSTYLPCKYSVSGDNVSPLGYLIRRLWMWAHDEQVDRSQYLHKGGLWIMIGNRWSLGLCACVWFCTSVTRRDLFFFCRSTDLCSSHLRTTRAPEVNLHNHISQTRSEISGEFQILTHGWPGLWSVFIGALLTSRFKVHDKDLDQSCWVVAHVRLFVFSSFIWSPLQSPFSYKPVSHRNSLQTYHTTWHRRHIQLSFSTLWLRQMTRRM